MIGVAFMDNDTLIFQVTNFILSLQKYEQYLKPEYQHVKDSVFTDLMTATVCF